MTDAETKRKDRLKLCIAATAIGLGCIGNRIVDREMDKFDPPPVKAPEEPKREKHDHRPRIKPVEKPPGWVQVVTKDEGRGRG